MVAHVPWRTNGEFCAWNGDVGKNIQQPPTAYVQRELGQCTSPTNASPIARAQEPVPFVVLFLALEVDQDVVPLGRPHHERHSLKSEPQKWEDRGCWNGVHIQHLPQGKKTPVLEAGCARSVTASHLVLYQGKSIPVGFPIHSAMRGSRRAPRRGVNETCPDKKKTPQFFTGMADQSR